MKSVWCMRRSVTVSQLLSKPGVQRPCHRVASGLRCGVAAQGGAAAARHDGAACYARPEGRPRPAIGRMHVAWSRTMATRPVPRTPPAPQLDIALAVASSHFAFTVALKTKTRRDVPDVCRSRAGRYSRTHIITTIVLVTNYAQCLSLVFYNYIFHRIHARR